MTTNELVPHLDDTIAAENFIQGCTDGLLGTPTLSADTEASLLVRRVREIAVEHIERIEAERGSLEASPGGVRETVIAGLGSTLGWLEKLPSRRLVHVVRDVYVALNYTASSYHILYTHAALLGERDIADWSLQHLRDYTPAIRTLSKLLAWSAALESSSDHWRGHEVVDEITETLFESWSSEVPLRWHSPTSDSQAGS